MSRSRSASKRSFRFLVTGTDVDVGKTRVAATLALALRERGERPHIVKLVQTGKASARAGDADRAARVSGCPAMTLAEFVKAADPWSAALAEGMPTVHAEDLALELQRVDGAVVAEGAGGLGVPLNRTQNFATVAQLAHLSVVIAVGLRPGCMNHALLTLALCQERSIPVAGCVLVDRWRCSDEAYVADVRRALQGKTRILGILPFELDEELSIRAGAQLIAPAL